MRTWKLIKAHSVEDSRGKLGVLEAPRLPFVAERVFYVFDVPAGAARGAHAHKSLHQCLVCLTGSMDVTLDNGSEKETIKLSDPTSALYIPPGTWANQDNIAAGTTYFVLASAAYDEADYLRDYDSFLRHVSS
jgi:glyoxylate utilization-related uncharacterized protein